MRIVLDTNFIVHAVKHKVDFMAELKAFNFNAEACVLSQTLEELEKLINEGNLQDRSAARLGLEIVKRKGLKMLKDEKNKGADAQLLELNPATDIIATHDRELERLLREKGFGIIKIRQKKRLEMVK